MYKVLSLIHIYPQFFLLTYLASEDFLSMSSIAQKMGHSTAAATGMVDKLQEKMCIRDRLSDVSQLSFFQPLPTHTHNTRDRIAPVSSMKENEQYLMRQGSS